MNLLILQRIEDREQRIDEGQRIEDIGYRIEDRWRIEDRGQMEDRRQRIEDRGQRIDGGQRIEDRGYRIEDRWRIEDRGQMQDRGQRIEDRGQRIPVKMNDLGSSEVTDIHLKRTRRSTHLPRATILISFLQGLQRKYRDCEEIQGLQRKYKEPQISGVARITLNFMSTIPFS